MLAILLNIFYLIFSQSCGATLLRTALATEGSCIELSSVDANEIAKLLTNFGSTEVT